MGATIKDVAKYTGLSIATISKYINGGNVLDKNRIILDEAIKALDFKVNEIARGLKTSRTMTIGVLIHSLENIFITSIVSAIENILVQNKYSTIICDYREDAEQEKEKLSFLVNKMVDGIIMISVSDNGKHIMEAVGRNIPVVLIDRPVKDTNCDVVLVDNLNASYSAVEHLIVNGHRRIGIICGPEDVYTTRERLKGYLRVHEDYSIGIDSGLVRFGDYQLQGGYRLLMELMDSEPRPTAVFTTNYEMTLGAIIAINERNIKIPEDLSFIGFDNLQMSKIVKPSLSIVMQPIRQIGETAANTLLKRLKGDMSDFPSLFRLKTEFLINDSVSRLTG